MVDKPLSTFLVTFVLLMMLISSMIVAALSSPVSFVEDDAARE
jgi:hypothetical protein